MRRLSPRVGALVSSLALLSTAAQAQPGGAPPQPPPATAKPGAAAPKAGTAAPAAPTTAAAPQDASATPALPKIEVNDPLLTPVTPAPHMLNTWRDALTIISARSVDLAIARLEIERAEGLSRQALAAALPSIDASGSVTYHLIRSKIDGTPEGFSVISVDGKTTTIVPRAAVPDRYLPETPVLNAQITASVPVLAPRAWYGIGTAELRVKSAKLSVDDRRRLALAQVAAAIVGVYTAERVAEINRVGLQSALQRLDLAQRKARLGDGTRLDVLRAEQDAAIARSTLIAGDESLRKSREALGLALGSSEGFGVPPTISLNEMEQSLRGTCSPGSVDQRADIAQARAELEVAQRGVTDVKLAYAPTAVVSTTLSTSNQVQIEGLSKASWILQGVLSIPIWDGGARYGAMRVARANVEEAKIRLDAAQRGATLESSQATRSVVVAEQARQVAEQNRNLAREAARLSERAYAAGAGTSFDLVDAGRKEREAELNLVVQEFEVIQAKISALLAAASCSY